MITREDRFWAKVNQRGPVNPHRPELGPCWFWLGTTVKGGYGRFWNGNKMVMAHIFGYEIFKAKIPNGLTSDHLCRMTNCVRWDHVEPVTLAVNIARSDGITATNTRKTKCSRGHDFTHKRKDGKWRICRACQYDWRRKNAERINREQRNRP